MLIEMGVSFVSANLKRLCFQGLPIAKTGWFRLRWLFLVPKCCGGNYHSCGMTKLVNDVKEFSHIRVLVCGCVPSQMTHEDAWKGVSTLAGKSLLVRQKCCPKF